MRAAGAVLAGVVLALAGGSARAVTVDGTIVTNVAMATFGSPSGVKYEVSYNVTATFRVESPSIGLRKEANVTVQASGGTVTFTLWVVNQSGTQSAWNVCVTDRLPDQMIYEGTDNWNDNTGFAWWESRSTDNVTWVGGVATPGQGAPFYLRWCIYKIGIGQSVSVRYWARIL